MVMQDKYERRALDTIFIDREARQRRIIDVSDLLQSIKNIGVIQPIIITPSGKLIAGERRFTASKELGLPDIPVRYVSENHTEIDVQVIELEENVKRSDLHWRDHISATCRLHELYRAQKADWSQGDTAEALGVTQGLISQYYRVFRDIDSPKIKDCTTWRQAFNVLSRVDERATANALSELMEGGTDIFAQITEEPQLGQPISQPTNVEMSSIDNPDVKIVSTPAPLPATVALPESILVEDFILWSESYSGQPFNFVHCDFPYGINVFGGQQSGRDSNNTYNDSPDVYWALLGAFCKNLDRFMSHSAHLMFWFSMEHYQATLDFFAKNAPTLDVQKFPLIWHKTDNVGVLPDAKRGPRRVYETALIASREDRLIVKAVSNTYGAPTDKTHHHSTKPEPVLKHFFQMFIDEHSSLLDPTCGSGSALRAAESLGATRVLGLELDKENADAAKSALKTFRVLRKATK